MRRNSELFILLDCIGQANIFSQKFSLLLSVIIHKLIITYTLIILKK